MKQSSHPKVPPKADEHCAHAIRLETIYDRVPGILFELAIEPDEANPGQYRYRFATMSKTGLEITGLTREQIIGKLVNDVVPEPSLSMVLKYYEQARTTLETVSWEETSMYPAGERSGEVSVTPLLNEQGECTALIGIVHDITERKRVERELFKTNQWLQALLDSVPVGIVFSDDVACRSVRSNAWFSQQWDAKPADNLSASALDENAAGRKIKFLQNGRLLQDHELPLQRAIAENRAIAAVELEIHDPRGQRWFAICSGAPLRDAQGKVVGGVGTILDISKRKEAEETLRASEIQLRALLEQSLVGIYVLVENRFVFLNKAFASLVGYSVEELLEHHNPKSLIAEADFPVFAENQRRRSLKLIPTIQYSIRLKHIDGHLLQVEIYCTEIIYAGQRAYLGTLVDITERKKAEDELYRANQRFEAILNAVPVGVCYSDDATCLKVVANSAYRNQFTDQARQNVTRVIAAAPACALSFFQNGCALELNDLPLQRAVHENRVIRPMELEYRLPSGKHCFFEASGAPYHDRDGKVIGGVAVTVDITQRKRAEETLRASEAKLRALLEQNLVGIYVASLTNFFYLNQATANIMGHSIEELLHGIRPIDIVVDEDKNRLLEDFQKRLADPDFEKGSSFRIRNKKGEILYLEVHATLIEWDGRPALLGTVLDVTGRKQVEEELFNTNKRLETLLNAVPVGVSFSYDASCTRITGNPAALEQFQVRAEDNLSRVRARRQSPWAPAPFL